MAIHLFSLLLLVLSSSISANALVLPSSGSICTHNRNTNHHITLPRGGASKLFSTASNNNNDDINDEEVNQQKKKLTRDFFSIALPAFIQLAAEPLAGLVDTAYLGRLGPEVLGKLLLFMYVFYLQFEFTYLYLVCIQNMLGGAGKFLLCLMHVCILFAIRVHISLSSRVHTKYFRSCDQCTICCEQTIQ